MNTPLPLEAFAPPFESDQLNPQQRWGLEPFFTNLDQSVYVPLIFAPELIGALCSRASRAKGDLRTVFLKEYITPFLEEGSSYGQELGAFIRFLHEHPIENVFSNPRARSFYSRWLAQYGDDSIAQMAGMHLVYSSLSQVAIKHLEDQRIGIAPIEQSTRYVDYSSTIAGHYRYYTDPTFVEMGLEREYRTVMDKLFHTYAELKEKLSEWLAQNYASEKKSVIEKKAFDVLRGLLPTSTVSQVAFFGNGQSFEYMINRSAQHPLGEIRWAAVRANEELSQLTPSFLRRINDPERQESVVAYQTYLSGKGARMMPFVQESVTSRHSWPSVELVEYDPDGEEKVIAGILFNAPNNHASWRAVLEQVKTMDVDSRRHIIDTYFTGRGERWQKVGRALENVYVRFEIVTNIGAWRDLHRHRMLTQQRQHFTTLHGYSVPPEITEAGLVSAYWAALDPVAALHDKIAEHSPDLAQYAVTLGHHIRFMQWTNLRECFWEIELRTIPEGHPDYRYIEQEKFRLLERIYPLLCRHMRANLGSYDFARRGQEEKMQEKLHELTRAARA